MRQFGLHSRPPTGAAGIDTADVTIRRHGLLTDLSRNDMSNATKWRSGVRVCNPRSRWKQAGARTLCHDIMRLCRPLDGPKQAVIGCTPYPWPTCFNTRIGSAKRHAEHVAQTLRNCDCRPHCEAALKADAKHAAKRLPKRLAEGRLRCRGRQRGKRIEERAGERPKMGGGGGLTMTQGVDTAGHVTAAAHLHPPVQ